jgi:hypothetical protein
MPLPCPNEWDWTHGVVSTCRIDFTLLFQCAVLAIAPAAAVLLLCFARIALVDGGQSSSRPISRAFSIKVAIAAATCVTSLVALIGWLRLSQEDAYKSSVGVAAASLQFILAVSQFVYVASCSTLCRLPSCCGSTSSKSGHLKPQVSSSSRTYS